MIFTHLLKATHAKKIALAASATALAASPLAQSKAPVPPSQDIHKELEKIRHKEEAMRCKWIQDEEGWHKLPPRAWPPVQPKANDREALLQKMATNECPRDLDSTLTPECAAIAFDLASCLTFSGLDAHAGLERYRSLAIQGDVEAMTAVGVVLLEGINGVADDEVEAERWLRRAADQGSSQARYELAVLDYMSDSRESAFRQFSEAAAKSHTSALYMVADCLITGYGCAADPGAAIPLLERAAEQGHRLARAVLIELLDEDAEFFRGEAHARK